MPGTPGGEGGKVLKFRLSLYSNRAVLTCLKVKGCETSHSIGNRGVRGRASPGVALGAVRRAQGGGVELKFGSRRNDGIGSPIMFATDGRIGDTRARYAAVAGVGRREGAYG